MKLFSHTLAFVATLTWMSFAHGNVVFSDDFEPENGGFGALNYAAFGNWNVSSGTVDLIGGTNGVGNGAIPVRSGLAVDLDGSTNQDGTLVLRQTLDLLPGKYTLVFDLASTVHQPQNADQNSMAAVVTGGFGNYLDHGFTVSDGDDYSVISLSFTVLQQDDVLLMFQSFNSNDNFGAVIDNIELRAVPLPTPLWLLAAGLVTLVRRTRRGSK